MPFDIVGARNAGYSDSEIADELARQQRFDAASARKAGYSDQEILGNLLSKTGVGTQPTEHHWYDPTVNFAKDVASSAAEAPLAAIHAAKAVNHAVGSAINWATQPGDDDSPEQAAAGQAIRTALTPGTSALDQAEAYWKPRVAAVQQSLATPEATDLLSHVNKVVAGGIGSAIKTLPELPLGVAGMAGLSGAESYDQTGDAAKALTDAAKSALSMKMMGATHWMSPLKAVGAVSSVAGADQFITTYAQTGDIQQALKDAGTSAVQMGAMDIANRGMMPGGGSTGIQRDLYNRMTSNGTPTDVAADLAGKFNPNIQPQDLYIGDQPVPVGDAMNDYAETLGNVDALRAKGYSLATIAKMSPDLKDQVWKMTGGGSAADQAPPDMSQDQQDLTTGTKVETPADQSAAPAESAINVNAAPSQSGNILDEMLKGVQQQPAPAPEAAPESESEPEPPAPQPAEQAPADQSPQAAPAPAPAPSNPLTGAGVDQEIAHMGAVSQAAKAEELNLQRQVANGQVDPKQVQPHIALAKTRGKAADDALKLLQEQKQASLSTDPQSPATSEAQAPVSETPAQPTMVQPNQPGSPVEAPPVTPVDVAAHGAASSPTNNVPEPTSAQVDAGNYKKGHVTLHGLDISVENPQGSTRSGVSPSGQPWQTVMNDHYGYIRGTVGKDKDHVDVFIKPGTDPATASDKIFVVDQVDPRNRGLDEHKVMMGYDSIDEARAAYLRNYDKSGPSRIGDITPATVEELKYWLKNGDTSQRFVDAPIMEGGDTNGKTTSSGGSDSEGPASVPQAATEARSNGSESGSHGVHIGEKQPKVSVDKNSEDGDTTGKLLEKAGQKEEPVTEKGAQDGESVPPPEPKRELTSDEQADAEIDAALERRKARKAAEAVQKKEVQADGNKSGIPENEKVGEPGSRGNAENGDAGGIIPSEPTAKEQQAANRERLKPQSKRTAGEAASDAADHAKSAFDAGVDAINEIFKNASNPDKLGSGPVIDDKIWAQIKPHLDKMWAEAKAAYHDAAEALDAFVDKAIEAMGEKIVPYMKKYYREAKAGDKLESGKEAPTKEGTHEGTESTVQPAGNEDSQPGKTGDESHPTENKDESKDGSDARSDSGLPEVFEPDRRSDVTADYVHTDPDKLGEGSPKVKAANNIKAIKIVKDMVETGRLATPEERDALAGYTGWGAASQLFDAARKEWAKEHAALKDLLTPSEWDEAASSTQNAFYTAPAIINSMYDGLDRMGFQGGRIGEFATGVGNFFGMMPESIKKRSQLFGAERDIITATIAKSLYPSATIVNSPFEDVQYSNDFFDLAIGNPPFGAVKITDVKEKDLSGLSIHNYFFAKSIKKLRPGGILAQVVSSSLMDKQGELDRIRFAKDVKLLGAIRLPNATFKANAGTEVTTDIVFLQKLKPGEVADNDWTKTQVVTAADGNAYRVNEYFAKHPDMVLGDYAPNKLHPGEYVDGVYDGVPGLVAKDGVNLPDALQEAIAKLPANVYQAEDRTKDMLDPAKAVTPPGETKVWGYFVKDGVVHQRVPDVNGARSSEPALVGVAKPRPMNATEVDRVTGMLSVLDAYRRLQRSELSDEPTGKIELHRKALNTAYDAFVKDHGFISQAANERVMRGDINDYPNLLALEKNFDKGMSRDQAKKNGVEPRKVSAEKADIFTKRQLVPYHKAEKADTAYDALMIGLAETGRIDLGRMEELTGRPYSELLNELGDVVYKDPDSGTVLADEYLSGNVKQKLARAKEMAVHDPKWQANVNALGKVQPEDKTPDEINVRLGAHWVPSQVYGDFIGHLLGGEAVTAYVPEIGRTLITYPKGKDSLSSVARRQTYGVTDEQGNTLADATWLLERIFDNRDITIRDEDEDGTKHANADATMAANQKASEIKNEFESWLWTDPDRRELVAQAYNDAMNTNVERKWDGQHMITPGKSESITLHPQQKNVAWRAIQQGKVVMDHCVGAGKTYAIITAAMEMRRMGLSRKPIVVVPNHLVGQWAGDWKRLYPTANVLMISRKDFSAKNRKAFVARIATGDYDAVVIAHSSFGFIPAPVEYEKQFYGEQLSDLEAAIKEARKESGDTSKEGKSRNPTVKELEAAKDRFLNRLKKLTDKPEDSVADFDHLGVDSLFVDESHEYRTLYYTTRRSQIKGLGNTQGNKKTTDLFVKSQYLMDRNQGRGLFFATGTPISNTMAEVYTIQKYLNYRKMKEMGLHHFDTWANTFGSEVTDWELNAGGQLKSVTRFKKFVNAPELAGMYREFADVVTLNQLKAQAIAQGKVWPVPKVKGGKPNNIVVERSEDQADFMNWIVGRMENIDPKRPDLDNHLWCETHARMAGLDLRILVPDATDHPFSKVNRAVGEIYDIYKDWDARKGTQLVFCDLSTPKKHKGNALKKQQEREAAAAVESDLEEPTFDEVGGDDEADDTERLSVDDLLSDELGSNDFSVYDDMNAKLIARGVKENQIAFIHDYNTDAQKMDLYAKMNNGDVRVLFGSTSKMGAGMNVQRRLVALHHLDAPYMPKDLEQREGRIIRQGNMFYEQDPEGFEVAINRYATKQMYDARMWEINEAKAGYTEQFRSGGLKTREMDDVIPESVNAAAMKAEATGNPLIRQEIQLRQKVTELTALEKSNRSSRWALESKAKSGARADARHADDMEAFNRVAKRKTDNPHTAGSPEWEISIDGERFKAEAPQPVPTVPERAELAEIPEDATKEQKKEIEKANTAIVEAHREQVNTAKEVEQANEAKVDDNKKAAAAAAVKSFSQYINGRTMAQGTSGMQHFGAYRGFAVYIKHDTKSHWNSDEGKPVYKPEISFSLHDPETQDVLASTAPYVPEADGKFAFSPTGLFTRLDNMVDVVANPQEKAKIDARRDEAKKEAVAAQEQLAKPSPHTQALKDAKAAHAEVLTELAASGGDTTEQLPVEQRERWDDILRQQRLKKAMKAAGAEAKQQAASAKSAPGSTTLHSNPFLDPAEIVKSISGLKENLQEDIPKLVELGKIVYKKSGDKINLFLNGMRKYLGDKFERFRSQMISIYREVKRALADERGKVGPDINAKDDTVKVGAEKSLADVIKEKMESLRGDIAKNKAVTDLAESWDAIRKGLRPENRSEMAKQMAMAMRAAMGQRNHGQDTLAEQLNRAVAHEEVSKLAKVKDWFLSAGRTAADKVFSLMPAAERNAFMQAMDTGDAAYFAEHPELEGIATVIDRMFSQKADATRALGTGALKELRENYFPHIWERTGDAAEVIRMLGKRPIEGSKSFTKHRVFDDVNAGLEAGYKPISDNPIDLVFLKMAEMDKYLTLHSALQAAERAGGDIVRLVPAGEDADAPAGYAFIDGVGTIERDHMESPGDDTNVGRAPTNKYRYAAREDVAQILKNYSSKSLYSVKDFGIGKAYGAYMGIANTLNRFQLGVLSAFHAGFTSCEAVISHTALGVKAAGNGEWKEAARYLAESPAAWYLNPKRGGEILKAWRESGVTGVVPDVVRWLEMAGAKVATDTRFFPNDTQKMVADWSDGKKIRAALRSPMAMVEQSARPIMEMLVPRQKVGVFSEMADYWVKHNPDATQVETAEAMQKIWNRVDSRLGQVSYERLFMNGIAKNIMQGLIRAPGWTGGTILEVGGGIADLVKSIAEAPMKGGKLDLTDRAAYTLSLLMVTAVGNAILTAACTGEGPKDWRDLFAFRTGNIDEYGNPERFMLPTYMKDMYAYAKDPLGTLTHKAHPLLGLLSEIKDNKDYYGVEVRHPADNPFQQAGEVVKFVAKAFVPFWMRGVQKESDRSGSALAMMAPLIGIMPATKRLNQTDAEALASELAKGHFQARPRTQEEADRSQMKSQIGRAMRLTPGEMPPEAAQAMQDGTLTRRQLMSSMKNSYRTPIVNQVNALSMDEALQVWDKTDDAEREKLRPVMQMKIRRMAQTMPRSDIEALRPKLEASGLIPHL